MKVYKTEEWIQQGKSMHIFSAHATEDHVTHTHDFIEIAYARDGSATEIIDGASFEVKRGDIIFLNYGCTHAFQAHGDFHYINICFSPEVVGDAIITSQNAISLLTLTSFNEMRNNSNSGKISFFGQERSEIEAILDAMLSEYKAKNLSWYTVMENYLNILLTRMLRKSELCLHDEEGNEIWQEFSDFIDNNLQADLALSALASKCFYNPSYFSRAFKKRFQMSPHEYITKKRLQFAMRLLAESEDSVEDILRQAGFSDRSSFYHVFSKHTGMTPGKYRRLERKVKKTDK